MSNLKVDYERWKQAQNWEENYWVSVVRRHGWRRALWPLASPFVRLFNLPIGEGNDWNYWWADHFNNYSFLPESFENYIELGCGPFTNTRVILQPRRAKHIICSDPLAKTYVRFTGRWLNKQYMKARVLVDDHPIEECPFASNFFDCVVMINVLDHVRDADLCMQQACRIVKPDGFVIIGQELTNAQDIAELQKDPEHNLGHPILLAREDMDRHLTDFKTVHRKDLEREQGREPHFHYSTLVYAGQKTRPT